MQPKLKNQISDLSLEGLEGLLDSGPAAEASPPERTERTADSGGNQSPNHEADQGPEQKAEQSPAQVHDQLKDQSQDWTLEETARALGLSRGAVIRRLEDGILSGYRIKRSYGWVWRVRPTWLSAQAREKVESSTNRSQSETPAETAALSDGAAKDKNAAVQPDKEPADQKPDQRIDCGLSFSANAEKEERDAAQLNGRYREYVEVFDVFEESGSSSYTPASFREMIELKTRLQVMEAQYQEANQKLESANYKIGYLEARLEVSQEQLKLLVDVRAKDPWWRRWRRWFALEH